MTKKAKSSNVTTKNKQPRSRAGRSLRFVLFILLGVIVIATAVWVYLYNSKTDKMTSDQRTETHEMIVQADKEIDRLKKVRVQEEKKKEEAAKLAATEAANKAAEAAASGGQKPSTVDSSACNVSKRHNNPAAIDAIVNKKHCMQPVNYAPADLVTSHGASLSAKAIKGFNDMYAAAAAAGQGFYVTSSYRSYSNQVSTYNHWVNVSGKAGADTYSARPGYSEHQTGFVIDVAANGCVLDCFGKTSQYQWFQENAAKYGFIQRYYTGFDNITGYKAEEWHYRYVGTGVALDMKVKGVKTLEQYWNIPGGNY